MQDRLTKRQVAVWLQIDFKQIESLQRADFPRPRSGMWSRHEIFEWLEEHGLTVEEPSHQLIIPFRRVIGE